MADLMADPTLSVADLTLSEAASTPAHLMDALKEDVYLIGRHITGLSTFYLTRDDVEVRAAVLSTKPSTTQFWNVKPDPRLAGVYNITSFEEPDQSLTYDDVDILYVADLDPNKWTLDVRGSQFVIGDFRNEKAIDLDKNLNLLMRTRADDRWSFILADTPDNGRVPKGLHDWRDTKLESGIYFVRNEGNEWALWYKSVTPIAPLTTWSWTKGNYISDRFYASAFLFIRNDDGSYHISNWCNLGLAPVERFLQVFDGGPILKDSKSNCRLYRDKDDSDAYVIALSDSKSDPDVIVYDPSATKEDDKSMQTKPLGGSLTGAKWHIRKLRP